ncbi:hypothetical protein [uncultured Akkermansia sp.]|uniref:hypothetical protein n=1 Tax=uncultured Akkermansia sp. TaxID=512294 RepID=UPI0026365B1D|nr:hypothetical protein [uncultured Akkermansia sp.]
MSNYRDRYIARGIPEFDPDACAPYPIGQVPQSGWFLIEPAGTYTVPVPDTSIPPAKRWDVDEVIDKEALQAICEAYDPAINGGNGIQVNNDHLHLRTTGDNPALGWCRALDYGWVGGRLYQAAYISWVKDAHHDLNQGKYWAFSTEYKLADYKRVYHNGYSPTRLSGLAVTNNPDHEAQPGIILQSAAGDVVVHSRSASILQSTTMSIKTATQRILHSEGTAPEDEDKNKANDTNTNSDNPPPSTEEEKKKEEEADTTNTNNDDNDETNCNSEDEGWLGLANEIAKALNLPETATGDDILKAVTNLKTDFDLLKQQVDQSNGGTQAHSRAPLTRQLHSNQGGRRMDRKVTPSGVITHRTPEGKAVQVPQSDVDLVVHCRQAVDAEIVRHGRQLTPGEYDRAWSRAAEEFTSARRK